jgi:hypothetical protein
MHPPIEAFIDYPPIVEHDKFLVTVSILNHEQIDFKVITCLEKTCEQKEINQTRYEILKYNFKPLNKSKMQLKVTIKSKYKDLVITKTISQKIEHVSVKKNPIKVLPLPTQKELIYDSGKEINKNIGLILLVSICIIISIIILWH